MGSVILMEKQRFTMIIKNRVQLLLEKENSQKVIIVLGNLEEIVGLMNLFLKIMKILSRLKGRSCLMACYMETIRKKLSVMVCRTEIMSCVKTAELLVKMPGLTI